MATQPPKRSKDAEIRRFQSYAVDPIEFRELRPATSSIRSKSTSIIEAIASFDDAEQPKIRYGDEGQQIGEAPDGGYGWVVVLGCFIIHVVFGGIERSEGIYFLEFKKKFNRSHQLLSLPGAFVTSLRLFIGPVAGALCFRYSVRSTCLFGSALLFIGMVMNAFVEDFMLLFISHSILQGIGRGLLYTPSLIIVADYFDRKRGIANGLSTSGTGLGTFLLAPLQQFLFDTYGYTGAFMIIAAISLHTAIPSMLYKPLPSNEGSKDINDAAILNYDSSKSTGSSIRRLRDFEDQVGHSEDSQHKIRSHGVSRPGSINKYYESVSSSSTDKDLHMSDAKCRIESDIIKRGEKRSFVGTQKERLMATGAKLSSHLSIKLLKAPPFVMFCISITLFTAASKSTFTFMPALITAKGYTQHEAALALSITGAVDILGRISAGLLFDLVQDRLVRPVIFNIFIGLLSIVIFILPLLEGFAAISIACALNSILTGAYVSQKTVICMDVLGPFNIPNSIGLFIFFQGFGVFLGIPLTGFLGDYDRSYSLSFYLCGALMLASGIFMSLSNMYIRNEEKENGP